MGGEGDGAARGAFPFPSRRIAGGRRPSRPDPPRYRDLGDETYLASCGGGDAPAGVTHAVDAVRALAQVATPARAVRHEVACRKRPGHASGDRHSESPDATNRRFVLDAHAVLAMLGEEPGGDVVRASRADAENAFRIGSVHLGEVYHILLRRRGEPAARTLEAALGQQANVSVVDATWERARGAAAVRAKGGLSFADAFAVALARACRALLATGEPDYRPLEQAGESDCPGGGHRQRGYPLADGAACC